MNITNNSYISFCCIVLMTLSIFCLSVEASSDPLDQMVVVFEGNYSKGQIKNRIDKAMNLYNLPITNENYSRAASSLITLRKNVGPSEMDILDYMIRSYVKGVNVDFPSAAGLAATMLAVGDR